MVFKILSCFVVVAIATFANSAPAQEFVTFIPPPFYKSIDVNPPPFFDDDDPISLPDLIKPHPNNGVLKMKPEYQISDLDTTKISSDLKAAYGALQISALNSIGVVENYKTQIFSSIDQVVMYYTNRIINKLEKEELPKRCPKYKKLPTDVRTKLGQCGLKFVKEAEVIVSKEISKQTDMSGFIQKIRDAWNKCIKTGGKHPVTTTQKPVNPTKLPVTTEITTVTEESTKPIKQETTTLIEETSEPVTEESTRRVQERSTERITEKSTASVSTVSITDETTIVNKDTTVFVTDETTVPATETTVLVNEETTVPATETTISVTDETTVLVTETKVPVTETIPARETTIPVTKTTGSVTEETAVPARETTTLITEETTLVAETTVPVEETTVSVTETTVFVTEETTVPVVETTVFVTEKSTTLPKEVTTVAASKIDTKFSIFDWEINTNVFNCIWHITSETTADGANIVFDISKSVFRSDAFIKLINEKIQPCIEKGFEKFVEGNC